MSLYALTDDPDRPIPSPLLELCREVVMVAARPYNPDSPRALMGLLSPRPRVLVDRHAPEMAALVRKAAAGGRFDLIVASQWYMAAYLEHVPDVPAIFEEFEVGIFHFRVSDAGTRLERWRHTLTLLKMKRYFRNLLPRFGACTVASSEEQRLVRRMAPGYWPIEVVPNGVSLADTSGDFPPPRPNHLVFAGSFTYDMNYDAMRWFTGQTLPLIHAERPNVTLTITGNNAGLPLPYTRNVELTGMAPDIRPIVASSWISLAPLQNGGGTRLKILEAMALRSPVVATSKGAEGLEAAPNEHLLIADTPADYAAACLRLLGDPDLRERLAANALDLVRRKYDWEVILPRFLDLVVRVAAERPAKPVPPRSAEDLPPSPSMAGSK